MNEHDLEMYRGLIARRDAEINQLRQAVVRYCDRSCMATVEPMEIQQAIDRAFETVEAPVSMFTTGADGRLTYNEPQ